MSKTIFKNSTYNIVLAHLFFLFFSSPILSPFTMNFTIYIFWFIPLIDYRFINFLTKIKYKYNVFLAILMLTIALILSASYMDIIKLFTTIETLLYLYYLKKSDLFSILYKYMILNVFVCILQFVLYYINPQYSYLIGPTNISQLIWGEFATPTFTNFYAIFSIPRFCGFSREAGFFASLLGITFIFYLFDTVEKKMSYIFLFSIGFVLSFSKASIIIMVALVFVCFRKLLNIVPIMIGILIFVLTAVTIVNTLMIELFQDPSNESYIHRFSGYYIMTKLTPKEFIFGVPEISDLNIYINKDSKYIFLKYIEKYKTFTGLPGLIIHQGMLVLFAFVFLIYTSDFKFSGFAVATLITFTTSYLTSTSFIALGYFLLIYLSKEKFGNRQTTNT